MSLRTWKRLILGSTAAAALSLPSIALADPTCVYIMGQVDSVTVATPAVIIPVPESEVLLQPVRVHVDEDKRNIIGYSVRTPGVDEGANPQAVFVPGTGDMVASIVATTPELPIQEYRCVDQTVNVPAVPVYVPEVVLQIPGIAVYVPAIELNIPGYPVTVPGTAIRLEGVTIVIPAVAMHMPGVSVTTPDQTIGVTFSTNEIIEYAHYLIPNEPPAP